MTYPPILLNSDFQILNSVSTAPSLISKLGKWGKKSFPTKKMRKIQSSIARSRSNANGWFGTSSSTERYSRRVEMSRKMNGFVSDNGLERSISGFLGSRSAWQEGCVQGRCQLAASQRLGRIDSGKRTCTRGSEMPLLSTLSTSPPSIGLEEDVLSQDLEVRLVRGKGEHDQIGVLSSETRSASQHYLPQQKSSRKV